MAFISFVEIASESRKATGRVSKKNLLSITQSSFSNKNSTLTFRVSQTVMDGARFKEGDKVDIQYNDDSKAWKIILDDEKGYKISKPKSGSFFSIKFTLYEKMQKIFKEDPPNTSNIKSNDDSVDFKPGEVYFMLDNDSLTTKYK